MPLLKSLPELWFLCSGFDPRGGDSCRILELAHEAKRRLEVRPVIVTTRTGSEPRVGDLDGIKIVRIARRFNSPWDDLIYAFALSIEIKRCHRSLRAVHINSPGLESALVIRTAQHYGIRVVIQMTLMGSDDPKTLCEFRRYSRPVAKMLVKQLGQANAILGLSRALTDCAIEFGWAARKISLTAIAKDPECFRPPHGRDETRSLRDKLRIPHDAIVLAYVGYLSLRKGIDVLIEAWKEISTVYPEALLVLAGEFGKKGDLNEAMFHDLQPSTYRLLNRLSREEVSELLRASDLFVFPSRREGFGAALLEAVMSGLPVVASHLPGVTDMLVEARRNGILCEPGNRKALVEALVQMIHSRALRASMGSESLRISKRFYPDRVWPVYERAYLGNQFETKTPESSRYDHENIALNA